VAALDVVGIGVYGTDAASEQVKAAPRRWHGVAPLGRSPTRGVGGDVCEIIWRDGSNWVCVWVGAWMRV